MFTTKYDSAKKIWFGRHLAPFHNESVSLGRAIYRTLFRDPRKLAQISDDTGLRVTNGEICDQMLKIASNLSLKGAKRDQVIAIVAKNGPLIAPATFAAFLLAIPVNTLDPNYVMAEMAHMFSLTKPSIVFCDHDNYSTVKSALIEIKSSAKIINFGSRISGVENIDDYLVKTGLEDSLDIPDVDGQTCSLILCSSGSTGLSKGVSFSHQYMLYVMENSAIIENSLDGVMLCFSSLYWYTGIVHLLATTFYGMLRIITTESFSADLLLNLVEKYKVTHILSPPFQFATVLDCTSITPTSLVTIRDYMVGGSIVPEEKWNRMQEYLPNGFARIMYGLSEVGLTNLQEYKSKKYCVGKLAPDMQLKIVNLNNENLGPGERGEICFNPRFKFLVYYGNNKATAEIFDEDGWIHSGDIGLVDNDGDLHIVDRMKEVMKYCNHQVSPSEIENIVCRFPEVEYVAVVGIPDPVCTDLPAALVVLREDANITADDIYQLVASNLSNPMHLRGGVYFVESLPLTPSGKVIKNKVKEKAIELYRAQHEAQN